MALSGSLRAAQPQVVEWAVPGLPAPAEIRVDRWGVPHIRAESHYEAFFVQGFNAARDRLWQIDLWRRRGLGQLSEVLGSDYVDQDRAARLFLYRGSMYREWLSYGSDAKRIATAFAAGVNAWISLTRDQPELLAPEFGILGYQPALWKPADVVRIRSHGLWRNVASEVARARMVCAAGLEGEPFRKVLEPEWRLEVPEGTDPCRVPADVLDDYFLAKAPVRFDTPGSIVADAQQQVELAASIGSNNWAVAPSRTATGRAILANDPHRDHAVPSLRYIAHLQAPGLNVIGAGEPGLPGISIGHNERIAFGLTIFSIDQEDLYFYPVDAAHPDSYVYAARREQLSVINETIKVRDAAPVVVSLEFTRHGPVVHRDDQQIFVVRAAWLEPGMAPYFGSVEYMRAQNWDQFLAALNRWGAPAENQVYADVDGNIGYKPAGLAPRRTNFDGLLPVAGDGRYEWQDYLDMDLLPVEHNPDRGWVATANALTLPSEFPVNERRLGFEWTAPWRQNRIREQLSNSADHRISDSLALQRDYHSGLAHRVVARLRLLTAEPTTDLPDAQILTEWDAEMVPTSAPAALWSIWYYRHLAPAVLNAALPAGTAVLAGYGDSQVIAGWLEESPRAAELLAATLEQAAAEHRSLGEPTWGELHQMRFQHPLAGHVDQEAVRQRMSIPALSMGGSANSPNNTRFGRESWDVRGGASWRMVLDVGNWDAGLMTSAPGQSGDYRSPHYADLAEGWASGGAFPLLFSDQAIAEHTEVIYRLKPAVSEAEND